MKTDIQSIDNIDTLTRRWWVLLIRGIAAIHERIGSEQRHQYR